MKVDGKCIPVSFSCANGFKKFQGKCIRVIQCKVGYQMVDNNCVLIPCSITENRINGVCRKIKCPVGWELTPSGTCMSIHIICKSGFKQVGDKCFRGECKEGYVHDSKQNECVKKTVVCTKGFEFFKSTGDCHKVKILCANGFIFCNKVKRCVKIVPKCPEGFKLVKNTCHRVIIKCASGFELNKQTKKCEKHGHVKPVCNNDERRDGCNCTKLLGVYKSVVEFLMKAANDKSVSAKIKGGLKNVVAKMREAMGTKTTSVKTHAMRNLRHKHTHTHIKSY